MSRPKIVRRHMRRVGCYSRWLSPRLHGVLSPGINMSAPLSVPYSIRCVSSQSNKIVSLQSLPSKVPCRIVTEGSPAQRRVHWESQPRTVLMIKKRDDDRVRKWADVISRWVADKYNCRVLAEPTASKDLTHLETYSESEKDHLSRVVDFVITLGGDGTLLHVNSLFSREVPPILSFHQGTLGFLMPFAIDDYTQSIAAIMRGGVSLTSRMRLLCNIYQHKTPKVKSTFHVLNEVNLYRGLSPYAVSLSCHLDNDGQEGRNTSSFDVVGDGVILCTPSGSSAYSRSCAGPLVHPGVGAMVLNPICPSSGLVRALVIPADSTVMLKVLPGSKDGVVACFDSQHTEALQRGDWVEVSASPYPMLTVNHSNEMVDWATGTKKLATHNTYPPAS